MTVGNVVSDQLETTKLVAVHWCDLPLRSERREDHPLQTHHLKEKLQNLKERLKVVLKNNPPPPCVEEVKDIGVEATLPNDKCFEKTEDADGGEDSIKIILDDVCPFPDIHNEVTMNVEQEDITADRSVDNAHSEDVLLEDKPKNEKAVERSGTHGIR